MTNRTEYTDKPIEMTTVEDELYLIALTLESRELPLTLANATDILSQGLANAPAMWKLTLKELPDLWAKIVEGV